MPSTPTDARAQRARVAALTRYVEVDDPAPVEARTRLSEAAFLAAVERALAIAPPITAAIRERVNSLLSAGAAA